MWQVRCFGLDVVWLFVDYDEAYRFLWALMPTTDEPSDLGRELKWVD